MAAHQHTQSQCNPWNGKPEEYQIEAYEALIYAGSKPSHWAWITPMCGTETCINPEHLICNEPVHLKYPSHVCIYCGRPADTVDHLLPNGYTGTATRRYTAVVPACRWCNSSLGSRVTWSITERREMVNEMIRRKYKTVLRTNDFTKAELHEFGPSLRMDIEASLRAKKQVQEMLDWPVDPAYDLRALELSGIENGYAIGLLVHSDLALRHKVRSRLNASGRPTWTEPEVIEPRHLSVSKDGIVSVRRSGRIVGNASPTGDGTWWVEDSSGWMQSAKSRTDALNMLAARANAETKRAA